MEKEKTNSFITRENAVKKIMEKTDYSIEDVEYFYGDYIISPACIAVGQKIKSIREENSLSLEMLANLIPCSPEFIEITEEGLIPPGLHFSKRFIEIFSVGSWEKIFGEVKDAIKSVDEKNNKPRS